MPVNRLCFKKKAETQRRTSSSNNETTSLWWTCRVKKYKKQHSREMIWEIFLIRMDSQWDEWWNMHYSRCTTERNRSPRLPWHHFLQPATGGISKEKHIYEAFTLCTTSSLGCHEDTRFYFFVMCKIQVYGRNYNINTGCVLRRWNNQGLQVL